MKTYDQLIGINRKIIEINERMEILETTNWWKSDYEKDTKISWILKFKSIVDSYKKKGSSVLFLDLMKQIEDDEEAN